MDESLAGPHAIDPEGMMPEERIADIGRILCLGFLRLRAAKSTSLSAGRGDGYLDFPPDQRRHADTRKKRKA